MVWGRTKEGSNLAGRKKLECQLILPLKDTKDGINMA